MVDQRANFESIYRAHGAAVRGFVQRRVPPGEADDVVADVFVAAWRRIAETPADPLPWLLGIARGTLANRRRGETRRRALHQRLAGVAAPEARPGPEPALTGSDSPLLNAVALLGERDQEVLRLVAWDGLERSRAAAVLGISSSLFSVRLHRARRRLERMLSAEQKQEPQRGDQPSLEAPR